MVSDIAIPGAISPSYWNLRGNMVKISRYHRRFVDHRKDDGDEPKHVRFGKVDRSKYPKPITWIIFSIAGAVLMWLILQFFVRVF